MKNIWIISDSHFNHFNIIKYCNRPFSSIEEMNEEMIKKWNDKVKKGDIVIHLGDFARRNIKEIRERLNGSIILIIGNHDESHLREINRSGFTTIKGILKIGRFLFTHEPLLKEEIPKGFINVHGHIHEKESLNGINVSVERINYSPINFNKLKFITNRY